MKVLHISTTIEWRGGDKQLLTTYEVLKNFKDIQHVVLCPKHSVLSEKCKSIGIEYFTASRKSKFSLSFLKEIIKITRQEEIDVIHVHDSIALSLSSLAIKFLPDVSLIYSRKRNNRIKNNYFKRVKYNNSRISNILCVSQAVKDVLVLRFLMILKKQKSFMMELM
ncbi:glycosyltransferase family 4 protein [Antarcticibacterium sp. 1MA-6-2]|uniref:glycosyltransferase n=1 Tax=Antarcticibacterium sp. 1MA-6-2 TaxID=2908210 RepID=UPI001F39F66A|nr:glycosyltransferase [Antarcticibacterium sp. 1MA-6-2]UJH92196.1 glycosyltransferase family 4 protein [Antarcticibacterium sp. 1MA-6-2]